MSNQKNLCNVMREQWRALMALIDYVAGIMRRMLNQIAALMDRIKNTILKSITNAIRDLKDIISKYLGLKAIDNNAARKDFCTVLYSCKPALEILSNYISKDLFSWIFGPDEFKTYNLSAYGITQQTFNSKFEVFEYVACRLSLSGLLDSVVENMISNLLGILSKYEKYLTLDWWLKNTVWGRVLSRAMDDYESFFNNRVKPLLEKLTPFLDCGFALCDFSQSTTNYLNDFQDRYRAEMRTLPDLRRDWRISKDELSGDLKTYFDQTQDMMDELKRMTGGTVAQRSEPVTSQNYKYTPEPDEQESTETSPYSKIEEEKLRQQSSNALTPKLQNKESQMVALRSPLILKTPNSVEVT